MDVDVLYQHLLVQSWPGLSRTAFARLLSQCQQFNDLFSLSDERCLQAGAQPQWLRQRSAYLMSAPKPSGVLLGQAEQLRDAGVELISLCAPTYPALLREIPDPPPLLFCLGTVSLLERPQLAVVGSRSATRSGLDLAYRFSEQLSKAGLTLTSGLAYGVDSRCHQGALQGVGSTVAVLGTGLDVCYPRRHHALQQQIAEQGLLVSEFPPGTGPRRSQFPQRNRIISGLSLGVLVVEAALRSGSLITARFALEQGRDVFAIPGSIHNPLARGCHALIREGACLVETVEDILQSWHAWHLPQPLVGTMPEQPAAALTGPQQDLLRQLPFEPVAQDVLIEGSGLPPSELLALLLSLEMEGWIERRGACWMRCQ